MPERLITLIEELRHTTLAQIVRQIAVILATIMPIWLFAGSWIQAQADDAFINMLQRQGISPKNLSDVTKKVDEIDKKTDKIGEKQIDISKDVDQLKDRTEALKDSVDDTKGLILKLLDNQLSIDRRIRNRDDAIDASKNRTQNR